jgi:methyltransferase (TIGR00027 family)
MAEENGLELAMKDATPSRTAKKVALNIVSLGSRRDMASILPPGIVDATARLLVASGAVNRIGVRFSRSPMAVWIYLGLDWMMPKQFEAFAHRKAFCEHRVREVIARGTGQVLVLGAGYDTLGWRLAPEYPDVMFFEIDHPATARLKSRGIAAMGVRDNLELIAQDLNERPLADLLRATDKWNSTISSVIVAEGLLMYLPATAVKALLMQCAEVCGAGSCLVFTYIGTRANGRPDAGPCTRWVLRLLKVIGEPLLWSIHPDKLLPFLEKCHWTTIHEEGSCPEKHGVEYLGVAVK